MTNVTAKDNETPQQRKRRMDRERIRATDYNNLWFCSREERADYNSNRLVASQLMFKTGDWRLGLPVDSQS